MLEILVDNAFSDNNMKDMKTAPKWLYGAVLYQIFPDRFCNGDPSDDVDDEEYEYDGKQWPEKADWTSKTKDPDYMRFYGGDLKGILDKLPYLKSLGIDCLYLNPVFESLSNHKYDIEDYETVDHHLTGGSKETANAFFAEFIKKCHAAGIRVMIDGVFNHCGHKNPIFEKFGADSFWWDNLTLPKIEYEKNPELVEYIMNIGAKWISEPYNADGWRLDVAADLGRSEGFNHSFWKGFNETVKSANPEAAVIAEHYGDPSKWLFAGEWDSVMNYDGFMDPVSYFLTGISKHSDMERPDLYANAESFFDTVKTAISRMPKSAVFTAMNQLDNHDHSRFMTRTARKTGKLSTSGYDAASEGIDKGIFMAGAVMQMTWPGAPCIYYGDETGLCGWTDPDSRRPYPWGHEDMEMIDLYSYLVSIHKLPVFMYGSLYKIYAKDGVIVYGRTYEKDGAVVIVNASDGQRIVNVNVSELFPGETRLTRVIHTTKDHYSVGRTEHLIEGGPITFKMEPHSSKVYLG